jgi:hypothetical protein
MVKGIGMISEVFTNRRKNSDSGMVKKIWMKLSEELRSTKVHQV